MPQGELRRKDRAMSVAESEALLDRALVGRLGTIGPEEAPYVVPMSFVYDPSRRTLFLHCATEGHKLDNLAHNPRACFEVDEPGQIVAAGPHACDTTQPYRSVVCFGVARVVFDGPEKEDALKLLIHKYIDRLMPERRYEPELREIDSTAAILIQIEKMTGKERKPQQ